MKTITMDFETYKEELEKARKEGAEKAVEYFKHELYEGLEITQHNSISNHVEREVFDRHFYKKYGVLIKKVLEAHR
jgi:hypothetical protein